MYSISVSPKEENINKFDFWTWREQRRDIIALLRAVASVEIGRAVSQLHRCADAMEVERFTNAEEETLNQYLSSRYDADDVSINDQTVLKTALQTLVTNLGAEVDYPKYVMINPDWEKVGREPRYFAGELNGVYFEAKVPQTEEGSLEYSVVWIDKNGEDEPLPLLHAYAGRNLSYAYSLWDWVLARHLFLECSNGKMKWPSGNPVFLEA